MIEFYLILAAVNSSISGKMFWRLLIGTVGMLGWGFILYEIFLGEAGSTNATMDEYVKASFATMRFIVTVGWSIYPLGYFFGYLMGQVEDSSLNLVYNLADLVNKIAFCLAIWNSAKQSTLAGKEGALLPK